MKTPRIEEIAGEVWRLIKDEWEEKDGKLPSGWTGIGSAYGSYSRLIEALTEAKQTGIDEAVEVLKEKRNGHCGKKGCLQAYCINRKIIREFCDDTIKALQDKK